MSIDFLPALRPARPAWNKGRIIGQKRPLLPKHVWSIRVRLEMADNKRDLALFNMAIDSKLRGCDLVCLKVRDPSGDTCVMGSLNQLSVAARLAQFLNQIGKGTICHPKETYEPQSRTEGGDRNPGIQRWLIDAMRAIGDPWSFKINKRMANFVMSGEKENPDLVGASRSQHQIAKIARCELFMEPYGFICEGGIWSNAAPNYLESGPINMLD